MQFSLDLGTILQGLTVALLLWGAKSLAGMARWQAEWTVALRGVNGDNGIVGDVKALRQRVHDHGDELHALKGRVALNEHEIEELKGAA